MTGVRVGLGGHGHHGFFVVFGFFVDTGFLVDAGLLETGFLVGTGLEDAGLLLGTGSGFFVGSGTSKLKLTDGCPRLI